MKVYLAGPMSGIPQFNFPAFKTAAYTLRRQGHEVFSPAENDQLEYGLDFGKNNATGDVAVEKTFSLRQALADDTQYICMVADAIYMLPGWENSRGAQAEWALARALGHKIIYA